MFGFCDFWSFKGNKFIKYFFFFLLREKNEFFKRKRDVLFIGNFFFWNECMFVFFDFILKFDLMILLMFGEEVVYV